MKWTMRRDTYFRFEYITNELIINAAVRRNTIAEAPSTE